MIPQKKPAGFKSRSWKHARRIVTESTINAFLPLAIVLAGVAYAISARTWQDFGQYGGYIALAVFCGIGLATGLDALLSRGTRPNLRQSALLGVVLSVGAVISGVLYYSWAVVFIDLYGWLQHPFGSRTSLLVSAAGITGAIGGGLFWIRLRWRFAYGITEALTGVAVAVHRVSLQQDPGLPTDTGFYLAMLTAGIYLVVRGLDNAAQGLKVESDPVVKWLRRHFPTPLRARVLKPYRAIDKAREHRRPSLRIHELIFRRLRSDA